MCLVFGLTPSSQSDWLDYSLGILLHVASDRHEKDFRVFWLTIEEIKSSCAQLTNKRSYGGLFDGAFEVTDGFRLLCVSFANNDMQNAYYQGYTQQVEVPNLLVWLFSGKIIHAAINHPSLYHVTRLAALSGLYWPNLSGTNTPPGFYILGESKIVNNYEATNKKILRARESNERSQIPLLTDSRAGDLLLQSLYPQEWQSAEWGVHGLRRCYHRVTMRYHQICIRDIAS